MKDQMLNIEYVGLSTLKLNPQNPRVHTKRRSRARHCPSPIHTDSLGPKKKVVQLPRLRPGAALVADAIQDCTSRGDIVLDPFLGSGTTVIAAERTGRACFGMELDPAYVDTIVRRWQRFASQSAIQTVAAVTFGTNKFDELVIRFTGGMLTAGTIWNSSPNVKSTPESAPVIANVVG